MTVSDPEVSFWRTCCLVLSFRVQQDPSKHKKAWEELRACHGILVPGGFGSRGLEGKIQAIKYARFGSLPRLITTRHSLEIQAF